MSFELVAGALSALYFTNALKHSQLRTSTFNINSTGAKAIILGGVNSGLSVQDYLPDAPLNYVLALYNGQQYVTLARGLGYGDYGD